MLRNVFVILLVTIVLGGCTSSQFVSISDPRDAETLPVYLKGYPPEGEYKVLGTIETSGWIFTSNNRLVHGLKKEAQRRGADAVVNAKFFYIPHISTGIPAVRGVAVTWKKP